MAASQSNIRICFDLGSILSLLQHLGYAVPSTRARCNENMMIAYRPEKHIFPCLTSFLLTTETAFRQRNAFRPSVL